MPPNRRSTAATAFHFHAEADPSKSVGVTMPLRFFPFALAGLLLAGCSEFQITSNYDRNTNFAALRTYTWMAPNRVATGSSGLDREFLDERVRTAIDRKLAKKGYQRTSASDADFLVTYRSAVKRKVESTDLGGQRGYGAGLGREDDYGAAFGAGSDTITEEYEEGTIVISVLSSDGKRTLWSGSARAALLEDATDEARSERIQRGVSRILDNFPPR